MATEDEKKRGAIPGDAAQAMQKAQAPRMAPQNVPQEQLGIAGNPDRAARMQAQYEQPVTGPRGVVGQPARGIGDTVADAAGAAGRTLAIPVRAANAFIGAPIADTVRRGVITAAGGDPATAEGGANRYTDAAQQRYRESTAPIEQGIGDLASGARSAVLGLTGAQPAAQVQQSPRAQQAAQPAARPAAPAIPAAAKPQAPSFSIAGQGIAGRRGANGTMEYTNDSTALAGATGDAPMRGRGSLSIVPSTYAADRQALDAGFERYVASGDLEGALRTVNRNDPGAMQRLGQLEANRRQNMITVIPDSTRGRTQSNADSLADQAVRLARSGKSKAAERAARAAGGIAAIEGGGQAPAQIQAPGAQSQDRGYVQTQTDQLDLAAKRATASAQQRQQAIMEELSKEGTSPARRQALEATLLAMQGKSRKDTFLTYDEIIGQDQAGTPIKGTVAVDPVTGQKFGGIAGGSPSRTSGRTVGAVYLDANGNRARFGGLDAAGNEIWE